MIELFEVIDGKIFTPWTYFSDFILIVDWIMIILRANF